MLLLSQGFLTVEERKELQLAAEKLSLKNSPAFLGNFGYRQFKYPEPLPSVFEAVMERLQGLVPTQEFNVAFVQRYDKGCEVKRHRDPLNNVGMTVIALFGEYTGARNVYEGPTGPTEYGTKAGDVLVAPCTLNGKQGPWHSVTPVESGTRWALILNTIR